MNDPIAAARALIEPLTGYTPGPWAEITPANNLWHPRVFASGSKFICMVDNSDDTQRQRINDARLIAAAPALRAMVATLADALEAERAEVAAVYYAGQVDMQSQAYDACREWMRNDDNRRVEDVILALSNTEAPQ